MSRNPTAILMVTALAIGAASARASVLMSPTAAQLEEVSQLIERRYVLAIPPDSLEGAARRCFEGRLDRYSTWLDSAAAHQFEQELAGRFGGIGVSLEADTAAQATFVAAIYRDSPALAAGVHLGDTLIAIDGTPLGKLSLFEVSSRIRGLVGSRFALEVRSSGGAGPRVLSGRRAIIRVATVRGLRRADSERERYLVDKASGIAYLRIDNFGKTTVKEFDRAAAEIGRTGARALVLDLRDDPGGLTKAATTIADRFLDSGRILTSRARGQQPEVVRADHHVATRLPLAVLVNGQTASAAEILAASLQDNGRAIIVGSRSFGKGVILNVFHLKRTPGLLKLVTTVYERPSGAPMERHVPGIGSEEGGVWPDSGLAMAITEDDELRWSLASFSISMRMQAAEAVKGSFDLPPDPVLDRAIAALKGRGARRDRR